MRVRHPGRDDDEGVIRVEQTGAAAPRGARPPRGAAHGARLLAPLAARRAPAGAPTQPAQHRLYRTDGGGFTNVAADAGVSMTSTDIAAGFGAAFGDYDGDGDLDLFVAGWVPNAGGHRLFRNEGYGTFTDATSTALPLI